MRYLLLFSSCFITVITTAQLKTKHNQFLLPDSIKASGFYAEVVFHKTDGKLKRRYASLVFGNANMSISSDRRGSAASFVFFEKMAAPSVPSLNVRQTRMLNHDGWNFNMKEGGKYSLLILTAVDTVKKVMHYAGYIYLPGDSAWKLISTKMPSYYTDSRLPADTNYVNWFSVNPVTHFAALSDSSKYKSHSFSNRWLLRTNNTWKAIDSQTSAPPKLRPMRNIDSIVQQQLDEELLRAQLPKDSVIYKDGIFYQHLKEGNGAVVNLTDTVIIYYKGSLYKDGSVFDQTKEKPATFPLRRLIRGWQVGVPGCKVGGKVRLFIPSGSAYGIRTFTTSIPPNSILVFDIEIVDVKR